MVGIRTNFWCFITRENKNDQKVTENVIFVYLLDLVNVCTYIFVVLHIIFTVMIKLMLMVNESINFTSFMKVIVFLNNMSTDFQHIQSKALKRDVVNRFFKEANDITYI